MKAKIWVKLGIGDGKGCLASLHQTGSKGLLDGWGDSPSSWTRMVLGTPPPRRLYCMGFLASHQLSISVGLSVKILDPGWPFSQKTSEGQDLAPLKDHPQN